MPSGTKTPPEVEAEVVRLIREGKTSRQVSEATGVTTRTLTRIARDAGVEWARVGSGSSGTPEAMAKARGFQSEYARNRRATLADRMMDEMDRTLDLLKSESDPRRRQALMQGLDAATRSFGTITKTDQGTDYGLERAQSMLGMLVVQIRDMQTAVPPEEGTFED